MAYGKFASLKALQDAAGTAVNSARKFGPLAHDVLVGALYHAVQHNDASVVTNFFNALPVSANKKGISRWIMRYSSLVYRKNKIGQMCWLGKDGVYAYNPDGDGVPFYEMPENKRDVVISPFEATLLGMLKRYEKLAKEGKINDRDKDLLRDVDVVVGKWQEAHPAPIPA